MPFFSFGVVINRRLVFQALLEVLVQILRKDIKMRKVS